MQKRYIPAVLLFALLFALLSLACPRPTPRTYAQEEQKRVYLTFDDGPSTIVTNSILDTLKEEGIRATFFVVSDRARTRKDTLRRIAREGHTIGVHSATHDYASIYASEQTFWQDVTECADFIRTTTGVVPCLYRFPGGGAHEKYATMLKEHGYRIVCWNAVNGDEEIKDASAEDLLARAAETARGKRNVVLLMHDSAFHRQTAEALPAIIAHFRAEGYVFCAF